MLSLPIKMGLAVRRVDGELREKAKEYPGVLPIGHAACLEGWRPCLRWSGGVLVRYDAEESEKLDPLERQLEVNRAHAEATLALAAADEHRLSEDDEEWLFQRALGIVPSNEDQRFAEIASCPELEPNYLTSKPERYLSGVKLIEQRMGQATALGYGALLMAGVRAVSDLVRYGTRLQELFDGFVARPAVSARLEVLTGGLDNLRHDERMRLLTELREYLEQKRDGPSGRFLTLTQVIDAHCGLHKAGAGDSVGLAMLDAIMAGKLGLPVNFLMHQGRMSLEILVSGRGVEYWDPADRAARVLPGMVLRLGLADVLAEGYLRMARGYAGVRSFANGARVARWVIDIHPRSAEAHEVLAQCLLGLENPRQAIEECRYASELDPRLADAHLIEGNAHATMRRWQEAVESYKRAISLRSGFAEAFNNLGLVLARSGEQERALGAYREAVRIRPDYVEAHYNTGNLYLELEDFEQAIAAFRLAVKYSPRFAGAHYNMGQALYRLGELRHALAAYEAAVEANPKHAGAWHNMGIVYRDLGESDRAVEAIEKAVALNPTLFR